MSENENPLLGLQRQAALAVKPRMAGAEDGQAGNETPDAAAAPELRSEAKENTSTEVAAEPVAQSLGEPEAAPVVPDVPWTELGLSEAALKSIEKAGFKKPSPIQVLGLPIAMAGKDLIGSAQTGSGKTAAFALPMIERFAGREGTFGLVLAPTREIAQQIQQTVQLLGAERGIRSIVLIGGISMRLDDEAINSYPQIIIATPGRLCDHLDRGNIWLDYIEIVTLDEADRMLDMGFSDQLNRIMEDVPATRQTLLFSATITPDVDRLARKTLKDPQRVTVGKPLSAAKSVEQRLVWTSEDSKNRDLMRLLREEPGPTMVFTRSKDGATRLFRSLHSAGWYDVTYIHSDRLQAHREQALAEFKEGKYRILIATDVAGRGIHVDGVTHVINYDLPMEAEDYVHRIGRTGRQAAIGKATTLATPRDRAIIGAIQKILGKDIPVIGKNAAPEGRAERDGGRGDRDSGRGRGDRGRDRGRERSASPSESANGAAPASAAPAPAAAAAKPVVAQPRPAGSLPKPGVRAPQQAAAPSTSASATPAPTPASSDTPPGLSSEISYGREPAPKPRTARNINHQPVRAVDVLYRLASERGEEIPQAEEQAEQERARARRGKGRDRGESVEAKPAQEARAPRDGDIGSDSRRGKRRRRGRGDRNETSVEARGQSGQSTPAPRTGILPRPRSAMGPVANAGSSGTNGSAGSSQAPASGEAPRAPSALARVASALFRPFKR